MGDTRKSKTKREMAVTVTVLCTVEQQILSPQKNLIICASQTHSDSSDSTMIL